MTTANAMMQEAPYSDGRRPPIACAGHPATDFSPDPEIDFRDARTGAHIESLLHDALGPGIMLDLSIDPDAWAVPGDREGFEAMLEQVALDAREAMAGDGVLHMCVLNVHDRCGGHNDEVLVALSDTGHVSPAGPAGASPIRGPSRRRLRSGYRQGILLAERFAAENGAVFDMAGGPAAGTTISLVFPRADRDDSVPHIPVC